MPWGFRKRFSIGNAFRITFGKQSVSASAGGPWFRFGVSSKRGPYQQVTIPGTGFYNKSYLGKGHAGRHAPWPRIALTLPGSQTFSQRPSREGRTFGSFCLA